jgi:hypothetical protein
MRRFFCFDLSKPRRFFLYLNKEKRKKKFFFSVQEMKFLLTYSLITLEDCIIPKDQQDCLDLIPEWNHAVDEERSFSSFQGVEDDGKMVGLKCSGDDGL